MNFFRKSPQYKDKAKIKIYNLPAIALYNYPDSCVAFVRTLYQSVLTNNHHLLKIFNQHTRRKIPKEMFETLLVDDWKAI